MAQGVAMGQTGCDDVFTQSRKRYTRFYRKDDDGWQTKVPSYKRFRGEKTEESFYQKRGHGGQTSLNPRGGGRGSSRGGRQTVFYSRSQTNRGDYRGGNRQRLSNSDNRSNVRINEQSGDQNRFDFRNIGEKLSSPNNFKKLSTDDDKPESFSYSVVNDDLESADVVSVRTSRTSVLRSADFIPPSPPSSGSFSYRDALRKGLSGRLVSGSISPEKMAEISSETDDVFTSEQSSNKTPSGTSQNFSDIVKTSKGMNTENIENKNTPNEELKINISASKNDTELLSKSTLKDENCVKESYAKSPPKSPKQTEELDRKENCKKSKKKSDKRIKAQNKKKDANEQSSSQSFTSGASKDLDQQSDISMNKDSEQSCISVQSQIDETKLLSSSLNESCKLNAFQTFTLSDSFQKSDCNEKIQISNDACANDDCKDTSVKFTANSDTFKPTSDDNGTRAHLSIAEISSSDKTLTKAIDDKDPEISDNSFTSLKSASKISYSDILKGSKESPSPKKVSGLHNFSCSPKQTSEFYVNSFNSCIDEVKQNLCATVVSSVEKTEIIPKSIKTDKNMDIGSPDHSQSFVSEVDEENDCSDKPSPCIPKPPPSTPTDGLVPGADSCRGLNESSLELIKTVVLELQSQSDTKLSDKSATMLEESCENEILEENVECCDSKKDFSDSIEPTLEEETPECITPRVEEVESLYTDLTESKSTSAAESTSENQSNLEVKDTIATETQIKSTFTEFKLLNRKDSNVYFPTVSESWTTDSRKISISGDPLPQRVKNDSAQSSESLTEATKKVDSVFDVSTKITNDDFKSKTVSNELTVGAEKLWTESKSDLSTDLYSTIPPVEEALAGTNTIAKDSGLLGVASLPHDPNKIWSTGHKGSIGLPTSSILNIGDTKDQELQSLLQTSASPMNISQSFQPTPEEDQFSKSSTAALELCKFEEPKRPARSLVESAVQTSDKVSFDNVTSPQSSVFSTPCSSTNNQFLSTICENSNLSATTTSNHNYSLNNLTAMPSSNASATFVPQGSHSLHSQMIIPPGTEVDFGQMSRFPQNQGIRVPHPVAFVQASGNYPYPNVNIYDPQWNRPYQLDIPPSEWIGVNRFSPNDRNFQRPIHTISQQPLNLYNVPPPTMQHQKNTMFPQTYNVTPYQQGTFTPFIQPLPAFLQRPPPPIPSQFNTNVTTRSNLGPVQRFQVPQQQIGLRENSINQSRNNTGKPVNDSRLIYNTAGFGSNANRNKDSFYRENENVSPRKQNRQSSNLPHEKTLGDFMKKPSLQSDVSKLTQDNWKKSTSDRRTYPTNRKIYRIDHESSGYPPLPGSEDIQDVESQFLNSRKKSNKSQTIENTKLGKVATEYNKPNIISYSSLKPDGHNDIENEKIGLFYEATDFNYPTGIYGNIPQSMDVEMSSTQYYDSLKHQDMNVVDENIGSYKNAANEEPNMFGMQDLCNGGFKYFQDTLDSAGGLKIHQSTYVPYPSPCGPVTSTYYSTTDVRARIQWMGFKRAHRCYSETINKNKCLRMDVTVVCSKGSAVCCNSVILSTCSSYFHERLEGKKEDFMTVFVNVPSKIMKHFLQMMSCGEAFVPINDVNEVLMKAPIYLNLDM